MCDITVSDNLLVTCTAPSHSCCGHAFQPLTAPLNLPTRKDSDVTVMLEDARDIESKGAAVSRSFSPATPARYPSLRKTGYSAAQIAVGRNHVHWILGAMLAFFGFTMLELARSIQFGPAFLSVDQYENYEATSLLGDAIYELAWIGIATSLWLTMTCLDSVISGIMPNDPCVFLNVVAVELIFASTLAAAWFSRLINYWGLFILFWTSTTINPRTEWMMYSVSYMAICTTGLLLLNSIWIAQAAYSKAQEEGMPFWFVALQQVNDLASCEDDQDVELMDEAEEGFVNYDQYLFWDKR